MMKRPPAVALVGIGCLFPKAQGRQAFWANLLGGVDGIRDVPETHWKIADYLDADPKAPDRVYTARGGFLDPVDFDALGFGISPNNLEATDTSQLLGLVATEMALADAGYGPHGRPFDRKRTSVLLGVTGTLELVVPLGARLGHPHWRRALAEAGVDKDTAEDVVARIADSYVPWQENSFPGLLGNVVAGRIANRFDLGGSNCVVDAACASSLGAVHLAMLELQAGRSDMVVTGGVDCFNDIFMYMCFSKTPALSPTGDARPFDAAGDGTILGEGLGVMLLKRLEDAERDGDRVYAVLRGIGTSSDGKGNAVYAPSADGQKRCLLNAHEVADVSPDTIELVEAHGTGTKVGDAVEASALAEVFSATGRTGSWCALGSVKSQIGHTKAAAGAAGLIKAALSLYHKVQPPTIKVTQPLETVAPATTPFYVNADVRPWLPNPAHPRRAGVSSFGFGGSNYHAILEEHRAERTEVAWDTGAELFAFSASTPPELRTKIADWQPAKSADDSRRAAAASRKSFRSEHACRAVAVVDRERSEAEQRTELLRLFDARGERAFAESPTGAFVGVGPAAGKLAVLFPGQGSQYVGMLREWACRFPEVLEVFAEADAVRAETADDRPRLSDAVYPPAAFDDRTRDAQQAALRATNVAQPALGAVSLGALAVLDRFGVKPQVVAGHSYGELVALCAARVYDARTLHWLSMLRGRLMAGEAGDDGAMLAVAAPIGDVERLLAETPNLTIANRNAPKQAVLSGRTRDVEKAAELCAARGLRATRLQVSAAFHSPQVAAAAKAFGKAVDSATFATAQVEVYSNTLGDRYPQATAETKAILATQLAKPVDFVSQIERMHAAGVRTFVEVGPGAKLVGLVRANLEGKPHETVAVDGSSGARAGLGDLARALAKLAALGHAVELAAWNPPTSEAPPSAAKRLTVPLTGANHRSPKPARPPRTKPQATPPRSTVVSSPSPVVHPVVRPVESPRPQAPTPGVETSMNRPPAPPNDFAREAILAMQKAQEQTALLHKQFLEGQAAAQATLLAMVERLYGGSPAPLAVPEPPRFEPAPTPVRTVVAPPPPAPVKTPIETPPVVAAPESNAADVLLAVVAEKTGYPAEMLNLEMGLDADLGIDSIKRVEILAALQEKLPHLPKVAADELGSLRTLGDIVKLFGDSPPSPVEKRESPAVSLTGAADVLLSVVAEKTGYPAEMLNLDMGLDADLGIDSIKRVEILAALQEKLPHLPKVAADELGSLRTLGDIVKLFGDAPPSPVEKRASPAVALAGAADVLLAVVAEKTGYPAEMLNLEMGLDADLGIDSIKRVEILAALQEKLPHLPKVAADELGSLRTLGDIVKLFGDAAAPAVKPSVNGTASHAPLVAQVAAPAETLDVYRPTLESLPPTPTCSFVGEVWLIGTASPRRSALADELRKRGAEPRLLAPSDAPPSTLPRGVVLLAGEEDDFDGGRLGLHWLRAFAANSTSGDTATFAAAVVSGDGEFGFERGLSPASATLIGLLKSAHFEWPKVCCKAIDAAADCDIAIIANELRAAGPVEVGLSARGRCGVALKSWKPSSNAAPIAPGEVVVVSGGGRGVTAEAAVALAQAYRPTLVLFGRTTLAPQESAELAHAADEAAVKQALLKRPGAKFTPKELAAAAHDVLAQREIRRTMERIRAADGRAEYRSVDLANAAAVRAAVEEVRRNCGPIRGVVHGAGVLADRLIADKTDDDYARVFATKAAGAECLLAAVGDEPRFLAFFSSSTARFGRKGQADYAAANEYLNKLAQREARRRPQVRVVSVNWGPWEGGMVTPGLKQLFRTEGVETIPLAAGAKLLADLVAIPTDGLSGEPVEVVVLGAGSQLPELAANAPATAEAPASAEPMFLALQRTVDFATHPILRDHRLKGRGVLPAALMMEWFAHAALVRNPGLEFVGLEDFRVTAGVKVAKDESRPLEIHVGKAEKADGRFRIAAELRGHDGKRPLRHATATVVLGRRPAEPQPTHAATRGDAVPAAEAYAELLFHGPSLHAMTDVVTLADRAAEATVAADDRPQSWMTAPHRTDWLLSPRVLDAVFQLLIVWSRKTLGLGSLPTGLQQYIQYRRVFGAGPFVLRARVTNRKPHAATADVEILDRQQAVVAKLVGYEFVLDAALNAVFDRAECGAGS